MLVVARGPVLGMASSGAAKRSFAAALRRIGPGLAARDPAAFRGERTPAALSPAGT
jgi:hypothetical protein